MSRFKFVPVAIFVVAVAALGGRFVGFAVTDHGRDSPSPKPQQLLVVQDGHDSFGEVWESKNFAWSFPVVNRSDRSVTVEKLTGSCTCLSVTPERFTLEPGQVQVIAARIDFTAKPRKDENAAFVLTYRTATSPELPTETGQWVVSGRVKPLVTLTSPFNFGRHSTLAQPLSPLSVGATFHATPRTVKATSTDPNFRADVVPGRTDDEFRIVMTPLGKLPLGSLQGHVFLRAVLAPGEEWSETLPLFGRIVPDVEVSPPSYPGGGRLVGESFEFDVTLESLSGKPFSVAGVKVFGNGLTVAKRKDHYVVRQMCSAEGDQTGRVEFDVRAADGQYTTSVAVDYLGFRP